MSRFLGQELVLGALQQALGRRKLTEGHIFHSDRGVQYASGKVRKLLKDNQFIQSMSGKGNCYDNAIIESFFHTLKTELVQFHTYQTRAEAKYSVFEYIEVFYNRVRRHSVLDYQSPFEYERKTK